MSQLYARLVFYPTLWWNMLLGRVLRVRNWWDEVDQHLLIGARPFPDDVQKLAEQGIGAVVNTCSEYAGPVEQYQQLEIEQLHIPTVDFVHPSMENVVAGVDFIDRQIQQGKRVYVHCKAGRARSATVVICWMIRHYQIPAEEAQNRLLAVRPHVNPRVFQRSVVREFEQLWLNKS